MGTAVSSTVSIKAAKTVHMRMGQELFSTVINIMIHQQQIKIDSQQSIRAIAKP
jgi:predicted nucleic-acid-binding protein